MPRVNFGGSKSGKTYTHIPDGRYLASIKDIEETRTRKGDDMWKLRLRVEEGAHAGRLVFDNLVFSSRAQERLQLFCRAFGISTSGDLDLQPAMVRGRSCLIDVEMEDYEDAEGRTHTANKVAYEGYHAVPRPPQENTSNDDDLPF